MHEIEVAPTPGDVIANVFSEAAHRDVRAYLLAIAPTPRFRNIRGGA